MVVCPLCGGKGTIPTRHISWGDGIYKEETCNACHGFKYVKEVPTSKQQITMLYADYRK